MKAKACKVAYAHAHMKRQEGDKEGKVKVQSIYVRHVIRLRTPRYKVTYVMLNVKPTKQKKMVVWRAVCFNNNVCIYIGVSWCEYTDIACTCNDRLMQ